jgi:hypothetical protein
VKESMFRVPGTPFGFQLPFSQLFTSGGKNALVDKATQAWISAQAGISKDQVKGIYENLYGRGYVHGDGRDKMLSSLVSLTKKNPGMDLQRVGELQDSAARFGAESLERFNETLNKVPDIAHAANLNVNEFLAHMDELGKQFAEMGGSDAQGQNYAVQFTQATGMPATIGGALLNNTFVQSQLMSRTGLLPQQQALAGSSMLFQSSVDAAQQMVHMYSGFSNRVTTDKFGIHHSSLGRRSGNRYGGIPDGHPTGSVEGPPAQGQAEGSQQRGQRRDARPTESHRQDQQH